MKPKISLLITDMDNTLFDWFEFWYHSFTAMMERVEALSGVPMDKLLADAKMVHERHGTSEYAFLLQEMPSLLKLNNASEIPTRYAGAIEAYRIERKAHLNLYHGVLETLSQVRERGATIVAYTESMGFYSADRVRRLDLDGVVDFLYTQADHDLPDGMDIAEVRLYPQDAYELKQTVRRHTPRGEVKPSPDILLHIIKEVRGDISQTAYVGDSLSKDILMAQRANVTDVFAQYGQAHVNEESKERYELLRRVTHWTREQVEKERALTEVDVSPTYALPTSFSEVLGIFDFVEFRASCAS